MKGVSPPKGNVAIFSRLVCLLAAEYSLFAVYEYLFQYLREHADVTGIHAVVKAYKLYLEQMPVPDGEEPVLIANTRFDLVRFFEGNMLSFVRCQHCGGQFVDIH